MEAILVLFGLGAAAYVLLVPGIALALAARANARRDELEVRVRDLERRLDDRERALGPARHRAPASPVVYRPREQAAPSPAPVEPPPIAAAELVTATLATAPADGPAPAPGAAPAPGTATAPEAATAPGTATAPEAATAAEAAPAPEAATAPEAAPAPAPGAAAEPPAPPPRPRPTEQEAASPPPSLEEHLGLTWLTRVGAAAFLLGALFFFKYAVDNAWIGPTGRVAIGGAVGVLLIAAAELIRKTTKPRFVHALTGIGLATLFVSVWASAAFYQLLDAPIALAVNTIILFLGAALSLRYEGEPILILTLIAGFLNPIVLSTGQDRPFELFSYLLLITSVAHAVAHRLRFRVVTALAVLGVTALFGGWYGKFFDASDHRSFIADDVSGARAFGPYFELSARFIPLAFVGLFAGEWSLFALLRREKAPREGRALALAALILAHAGAALLLYDTPRLLAVLAIGLALCSILLLRRMGAQNLLVIPMGAAFLAFLAVSAGVPDDQRTMLVALLGVWTLVYLIGFLRDLSSLGAVPASAAIFSAIGAVLFDALAAALLIEKKPSIFVFLLGLSSAIVAFLASRSGRRSLRTLTLFATLIAVLVAAVLHIDIGPALGSSARIDPVFLTAAGVWSIVYVVAVIEDALLRDAKVSWDMSITVSLATIAFLATALLGTGQDTPALRALLTAGTGLSDLAVGALLLRPAGRDREPVVLLLAQALGLFAAAIAFALSGAPVTVLWAALAVVAAAISARTLDRLWLAVTAMLFVAALIRLLAVDVASVQASVELFFSTSGRAGIMTVPVLWNARAYALAGTGIALLGSAYLLSRDARSPFRPAAALAATLGYGLLLALCITEVRSLSFHPPAAPPYPLDALEWSSFMKQYDAALYAQRGWMAMSTTLVMAVFAALLLALGFIARDTFHRYLGLCLFLLTVLKLALWDVWNIERIYQIILLTGVGALLIGGGFLYARFGKRLMALMREGSPGAKGSAALIFLALLCGGGRAQADLPRTAPPVSALPVSAFPVMRSIEGADRAGDYFFEVDADAYRASRAEVLLGDLRIAGPDGAEVPYVIREVGSLRSPYQNDSIDATMLDPSVDRGGSTYATFRLSPRLDHCRVDLDLYGDTFLRKVRIETGEDPKALGVVIEGPYVYRVRRDGPVAEHLTVPYPLSQASLVRVTLLPESGSASASVRIRGGRFSCLSRRDLEMDRPVSMHPLKIEETARDEAAKATVLTLDAGDEGLPVDALMMEVGTEEFSRRVDVSATSYRSVWPDAGQGAIYRIKGRGGPVELKRVPISQTRKRWFKLTIHDEDSAPLAITGVSGEVRKREITFRAGQGGGHVLYAGDRMRTPPRYDLEEILARGDHVEPQRPVRLGAFGANPRFGVEDKAPNLPVTERYRTAIGIVLAIVLLGLSIWAIGLMRKPPAPPAAKHQPPS